MAKEEATQEAQEREAIFQQKVDVKMTENMVGQIGSMSLALARKDAEIALLRERNAALESALGKMAEAKKAH